MNKAGPLLSAAHNLVRAPVRPNSRREINPRPGGWSKKKKEPNASTWWGRLPKARVHGLQVGNGEQSWATVCGVHHAPLAGRAPSSLVLRVLW